MLANALASSVFMAAAIAATIAYVGRAGVELRVFPEPFPRAYAAPTMSLVAGLVYRLSERRDGDRRAVTLPSLLFGVVLGTVRHRCGSVYPAMLLHSAVNVFGG